MVGGGVIIFSDVFRLRCGHDRFRFTHKKAKKVVLYIRLPLWGAISTGFHIEIVGYEQGGSQ